MIYVFLFLFGTAIGSFLNVLIDRLPHDESIMGRSRCDYCKKKLAWNDLIPILSFFLLAGKCRYCKKPLSWSYPLIEFVTGVMFVAVWLYLTPSAGLFIRYIYLGIISTLIVIFFTDLKYHIIPDQAQMMLFLSALFLMPFFGPAQTVFINRAIAAFLVMLPIYFLHWVTGGKGMGFGDVKLAFIIGLIFGVKAGLLVLYFAFITGAVVGIVLMISGRKGLKSKIAFGPFLVIGIMILLFWQKEVFNFIRNLYGI